jgi:hypothetical protein
MVRVRSGGGVHNPQIMAHLAGFLPGMDISSSGDHGVAAGAGRHRVRRPGARDMAPEAVEPAFGHRGETAQ